MKHNTGEAILILGAIYLFTILDSWAKWLLLILVGLALATWSYNSHPKEVDELLKLQVEKLKLEINLMKVQAQFYVARGAALMRGIKK